MLSCSRGSVPALPPLLTLNVGEGVLKGGHVQPGEEEAEGDEGQDGARV